MRKMLAAAAVAALLVPLDGAAQDNRCSGIPPDLCPKNIDGSASNSNGGSSDTIFTTPIWKGGETASGPVRWLLDKFGWNKQKEELTPQTPKIDLGGERERPAPFIF